MRILLISLGTLSFGIGMVGVVVPGLPTTVFMLMAAACYVRSSERLYNWLIHHKVFGKFIRDYREKKAIPLRAKISAYVVMITMVTLSAITLRDRPWLMFSVIGLASIGAIVMARIKTY